MKTSFERRKVDTQTNLERIQQDSVRQMEDVRENMKRQVEQERATGAKTGLYRSTAFIDNVDRTIQDTTQLIDRMKQDLGRIEVDVTRDMGRLAEDFSKQLSRAESDYKAMEEQAKLETSLALTEARTLYDGENLLKALDEISETFGIKSQDVMSKYLNNIQGINKLVEQELVMTEMQAELKDREERMKYNEFLENDGMILQQSSL